MPHLLYVFIWIPHRCTQRQSIEPCLCFPFIHSCGQWTVNKILCYAPKRLCVHSRRAIYSIWIRLLNAHKMHSNTHTKTKHRKKFGRAHKSRREKKLFPVINFVVSSDGLHRNKKEKNGMKKKKTLITFLSDFHRPNAVEQCSVAQCIYALYEVKKKNTLFAFEICLCCEHSIWAVWKCFDCGWENGFWQFDFNINYLTLPFVNAEKKHTHFMRLIANEEVIKVRTKCTVSN